MIKYTSPQSLAETFFVKFYAKNRINNTIAAADQEVVWTNSGRHRSSLIAKSTFWVKYTPLEPSYIGATAQTRTFYFSKTDQANATNRIKSQYIKIKIFKNSNVWTLAIYVLTSKIIASIKIYIKYQRDVSAWTIKKIWISNTKTLSILWDNTANTVRSIHNAEVA